MRSRLRIVALIAALAIATAGCSGAKKPDTGTLSAGTTSTTVAGAEVNAETPPAEAPGSVDPGASAATVPGTPVAGAVTTRPKAGTKTAAGTTATPTGGGTASASGEPTVNPGGATAPADAPGDPVLFAGASNTRGITANEIKLCGHAALTYGPAFNATADDFNVYYSAINDAGGVFGRKITATYENDNYDPKTAIEAADACKAKNPFMILGGIGFDQIPGVRNWAEANKELYFHHIATVKGTEGKQYSYTTQPTVERVGEAFAELAAVKFPGKRIGILYRNSEFWQPGFDAFKRTAQAKGLNIVGAYPVEKNASAYQQQLLALKNDAKAEVVWGWENTIALTEMVKQAKSLDYSPTWLAFPFNLTAQTLDDQALSPKMIGLASWPGYSKGDYTGGFAPYADDMKEFERQYAKYRPNTDIGGVAGDLLWLNWVEQKRLVDLLKACGSGCTRDHLAGLLVNGYQATSSPTCPLDFSGGKHDGSGGFVNVMETFRSSVGDKKVNWKSTGLCKLHDF